MDKKKITAPLVCHGHSRPVVELFYSPITPDGFFLISASKVKLRPQELDATAQNLSVNIFSCHKDPEYVIIVYRHEEEDVDSLAVKYAIAISCDIHSNPMLRNGETGDWVGTFQGHKGAVWSCCLDKPALRAASASADFSAKLWDALTGDELYSFEHKHIVRACAFAEGTQFLLTGGFEKILRIYDLNRPDAPPREVDKSPGSVRTVSWLHSDQTILGSCSEIGGVRFWDVRSGQIVRTLETKEPVTSVEVSQDGRYITTVDGSTVKFWDANHFGLVENYNMPCNMESASLEPRFGNKFVAGGEDMWVHVFDFHTGAEIGCNKGHHGPVHSVRFAPGGESYASGSEDGTIRIWQLGPHDEQETSLANGTLVDAKDSSTNEAVIQKLEDLDIAKEEKSSDKEEACTDA